MKSLNGLYIYQDSLYVKMNCDTYIKEVLEIHGWTEPGKMETNLVEYIHPDIFK